MQKIVFALIVLLFTSTTGCDVISCEMLGPEALAEHQNMYVIERNVPGVGSLSDAELQAISQSSCNVLQDMGSEIQWLYSYITVDKLYSVYTAPNEEMVREHARQGGFTVDLVSRVSTIINPSTASD